MSVLTNSQRWRIYYPAVLAHNGAAAAFADTPQYNMAPINLGLATTYFDLTYNPSDTQVGTKEFKQSFSIRYGSGLLAGDRQAEYQRITIDGTDPAGIYAGQLAAFLDAADGVVTIVDDLNVYRNILVESFTMKRLHGHSSAGNYPVKWTLTGQMTMESLAAAYPTPFSGRVGGAAAGVPTFGFAGLA